MTNLKKQLRRGFALLIVLTMCLSLMNVSVFAEELSGSDSPSVNDSDSSGNDSSASESESSSGAESSDKDSSDTESSDKDSSGAESSDKDSSDTESSDKDSSDTESSDKDSSDTENPGEGAGDVENPGEGAGDVENPGEGAGDVENPGEGAGDVENPGEGTENPDEDKYLRDENGEIVYDENGNPVLVEEEEELPVEKVELPPEILLPPQYSEAVQAFLDAAAQLPEEVTEENAEEVGAALEALLPLYTELSEEEQELERVMSAYTRVLALYEQYTDVKAQMLDGVVALIGETPYESLQEAIDAVTSLDGETITLTADVTENVTVDKKIVTFDLNGHTWTGTDSKRCLVIANGIVTVQNGTMIPSGSLAAEGMQSSYFGGGCISIANGKLTVSNCTFSGDAGTYSESASYMGAGKFVEKAAYGSHINAGSSVNDVTITNCTFQNSVSTSGAVYVGGKSLTVRDCTFTGNGNSLQLNNSSGTFDVNGCTFTGGTRGIGASGGTKMTLNITNSTFNGFTGGPVVNANGSTNITGGSFSGNSVDSNGVVQLSGGSLVMDGTELKGNTSGGVVKTSSASNVTMRNVTATGNIGTTSMNSGGSVLNANSISGKTVILENVTATGNEQTKEHGGAFYLGGSSNSTSTVIEIKNCTLTGNTAKNGGGAIYVNNKGTTTITDTLITGNTANSSGKYAGGGIQVGSTSGTVTLAGSTRVYGNQTPNVTVKHLTVGATADIVLTSNYSSKTDFTSEENVQRATLVLSNETSFTGDDGNKYTLVKSDAAGLHYSSGSGSTKKFYWPAGYYTVVTEPAKVYLNGQHEAGEGVIVTDTLQAAVEAARSNGNKVYVCGTVAVTSADEEYLNSGVTFARCEEHPNGAMFSIRGDVTLDNAHIDGRALESNAALVSVSAGGHLTIAGNTVIENGKNTAGNGGGISLSQSSLTMTGGKITGNSAKQGGGIYAYSNINGSGLIFEGGEVTRNTAKSYGGGAMIGYAPSDFGVQGGRTVFDGNTAYVGGGVFINHDEHRIYRATFTNNTATVPTAGHWYSGGGIYIEAGSTVYMKNVLVTGNKTGSSKPESAVGVCPTGLLKVLDTDGLLSVNNGNDVDIGMCKTNNAGSVNPDATLFLSKFAPGGGQPSYKYSTASIWGTPSYSEVTDDDFANGFKNSTVWVRTSASAQTVAWARALAEQDGVMVVGNFANAYGSGIMTNGTLIIGTDRIDMGVEKKFVNADLSEVYPEDKPDQVIVSLVRMNADGTFVPVDPETRSDAIIVLNEENQWSYKWENLDALAEWGVAEASMLGWKLWNLESTDFNPPNAGGSITFTNSFELGTTFEGGVSELESNAYGRFLTTWISEVDGSYVTFVTRNDTVLTGVAEGETKPITESKYLYYKWQMTDDGQMRCVAVSETLSELIRTFSAEEIEDAYGTPIKFFYDENGNPSGYVTKAGDTYYWWSSTGGGQFKCTRTVREPSEDVINMSSEAFHAVSFKKEAEGFAEDKTFQFHVTVTINTPVIGEGGKDLTDNTYPTYSINGSVPAPFGDVPKTGLGEYTQTISIKAGDTVTITGLQAGDSYKIEEVGDDSFITYVDEKEARVAEGTVTKDDPRTIEFLYKNINKASLKIIKALAGAASGQGEGKEFVFTVTGPDGYKEPVKITGSNQAVLENLKPGTYTITEENASIPGLNWTVSPNGKQEVVVKAGEPTEVTFTNTYEPQPETKTGSLTITKVVSGGGSAAAGKVYTFVVTGPDGYQAEIPITGSGSWTLSGLALGSYKVTEQDASIGGYHWSVSGNGVTVSVTAEDPAKVTVTNTYTPPSTPDPGRDPDPDPRPRPTPTPDPDPEPEIPEEEVPLTNPPEEPIEETEVEEPEVPLSNIPEEEEVVEIPEEEVPLDSAPQTGDSSRTGMWLMTAAAACASLIWLTLSGKKREEGENV